MRTFAVAMVTTQLATPRFLLTIWRKLQTFSLTVSSIRCLPRLKVPISLSTCGSFYSWSRYFLHSFLAWLSLNFKRGWDSLIFCTAAPGTFIAVYLPIRKHSLSVNLVLTFFNFFSKVSFKLSYSITPKPLSSSVRSEDNVPAEKKNIKFLQLDLFKLLKFCWI